jgi:hypothetical protein
LVSQVSSYLTLLSSVILDKDRDGDVDSEEFINLIFTGQFLVNPIIFCNSRQGQRWRCGQRRDYQPYFHRSVLILTLLSSVILDKDRDSEVDRAEFINLGITGQFLF